MKRVFIDANVILRFFTQDPPALAGAARKTFSAAQKGQLVLVLAPTTVAEVVWVLESFYGYSRSRISATMTQFLGSEGLEVLDRDLLIQALSLYDDKNIDFADAFLARFALSQGVTTVCSFDNHFDRIPELKKVRPGHLPD